MNGFNVVGDIPDIIENEEGIYLGDLKHYWRLLFFNSPDNGYHNLQHFEHVLWLAHDAGRYFLTRKRLNRRKIRSLLVAAMMHDWEHPGKKVDDDSTNIERSIQGLRDHAAPEDREHLADIEKIIWATRFPHLPDLSVDLRGQIIREADIAQALDREWLNEISCGLAREWDMSRIDIMRMQPGFLEKVLKPNFITKWAKWRFPTTLIDEKIAEAQAHLAILGEKDDDIMAWPKAYRPGN